ncbi:MAG: urease subunit beta [Anaerotignaceae bacterium]
MIPGEIIPCSATVTINSGYATKVVKVKNLGDRPIQVGSHFHFFEANKFLSFNREETYGYRPDIASGTAIRFEPLEEKEVELVAMGGSCRVRGLNNLTDAQVNDVTLKASLEKAKLKGFE